MHWVSIGSPITDQSLSCSAKPTACNFSGCHPWQYVVQCVVQMAGLIPSRRLKRTPARVKKLKLDKELLQALVAELKARLASQAETKIDSDKITLL